MQWASGVLGSVEALSRVRAEGAGPTVALAAGISWLPWHGPSVVDVDDDSTPEHEYLDADLASQLAAASGAEGLAFFETRYFGGAGGQVATAWVDGRCVVDRGTVNDALRALGVACAPGKHDEWDTVGLQNHRSNPR